MYVDSRKEVTLEWEKVEKERVHFLRSYLKHLRGKFPIDGGCTREKGTYIHKEESVILPLSGNTHLLI